MAIRMNGIPSAGPPRSLREDADETERPQRGRALEALREEATARDRATGPAAEGRLVGRREVSAGEGDVGAPTSTPVLIPARSRTTVTIPLAPRPTEPGRA